jgi:hypothetical protein
MRLRDVGLAVGGAVFALVGLATLVWGRGQDRITGLALLFFSIAVLLVPLSGRLAARSDVRPRLDRIEHDGALQPALVIPGSRRKLQLMLLAALCFGAMGTVMAIWPEALTSNTRSPGSVRFIGIICALVFGAAAVPATLFTRGPVRIELLPTGLRWQVGAAPSFVRWDAITSVWPFAINNSWYLGIDADADGLVMPPRQRWLARANRAIARADASIALEAFPIEPERLAEVVAACAADAQRRHEIGTDRSLAWMRDGVPPESLPVA